MSAQILAERVIAALNDRLNANGNNVVSLRFRPAASATANGAIIGIQPATTAESLGLQAIELNAERRAMQDAMQIVSDELQKLISPDAPVDGTEHVNGKDADAAPIY